MSTSRSGTTRKSAARSLAEAYSRTRADHQSELAEDYVELIATLIAEKGEARGNDVAQRLGVANATVAKMMKRLIERGLVSQEPYRAIELTRAGRDLAENGRKRHDIVEAFLLALGVSAEVARIDSEGMEHHASHETLEAMARFTNKQRPRKG
jgi:DtxR family transcriptional regulator, manganese transport regulator